MNREIREAVDLCTASGALNEAAVGWTRRPLHRCNLVGHRLRKKRWNEWTLQNDRFFVVAGVADYDYVGSAWAYVVDLRRRRVVEKYVRRRFARGIQLGETVGEAAGFAGKELTVSHARDGDDLTLTATSPALGAYGSFAVNARVMRPALLESLGIAVPLGKNRFHYVSRHVGLPVSGRVRIGKTELVFEGEDAFAHIEIGRGVLPRQTNWIHGVAAGDDDDHIVGISLGGKWTDGTGMSENFVSIEGRLHKVDEELEWSYDELDVLKPWHVRTPQSGAVDLTFEPVVERHRHSDALVVRSRVHRAFGIWSGTVRAGDGTVVNILGLPGWAEERKAVW